MTNIFKVICQNIENLRHITLKIFKVICPLYALSYEQDFQGYMLLENVGPEWPFQGQDFQGY